VGSELHCHVMSLANHLEVPVGNYPIVRQVDAVRRLLLAGGRWIRTLGPASEGQPSDVVFSFARDSSLEGDGFEPSVPRGGQHFSRPPRSPATIRRPLSQNWILTIDKGRFTVRRARLAPAMISTPGQRASRRRQRGALPAWSLFRLWPAGTRRWRPAGRGNDTAIPGHRNNPTRHLKRATDIRSGGMCPDSGGSRPRIRDDVAQHSDLISLGVPG
jgi:hypothetical protein